MQECDEVGRERGLLGDNLRVPRGRLLGGTGQLVDAFGGEFLAARFGRGNIRLEVGLGERRLPLPPVRLRMAQPQVRQFQAFIAQA